MSKKYRSIYVEVLRTTDMAVLCESDGKEDWIPRSVINGGDDLERGDILEIEVEEWFAENEGWE